GGLADEHLVVLGERDDRGCRAIALTVLDHARLTAFHNRDARVGRAEVDADDFAHGRKAPKKICPKTIFHSKPAPTMGAVPSEPFALVPCSLSCSVPGMRCSRKNPNEDQGQARNDCVAGLMRTAP